MLFRSAVSDPRNKISILKTPLHHPIDNFIVRELDAIGIPPSPPAEATTLIRRLYLDLLGTVPSPEECNSFLQDDQPDRIEALIDRLLASPQFGERWGRFWLDQARYADSNGFTIDGTRVMWPYRDWVIAALNSDMPFDQFTIEQLAGDLLEAPTKSQRIGSAFHRNTLINEEGGVKADQYRHEAIIDRVNTTGAVWLGLTLGCAQCHTHKYDPVSIDDYYHFYAFFNACADNNSTAPTVDVLEQEVYGLPESVLKDLEMFRELKSREKKFEAEVQRLRESSPPALAWEPVAFLHASGMDGNVETALLRQDDGSVLVPETVRGNSSLKVEFVHRGEAITAIRLRTLTDPSLPHHGPGKAGNGNFVLSEIQIKQNLNIVPLGKAWADHSQPKYPVSDAIDGDTKTGWAINTDAAQIKSKPNLKMNAPHEAIFSFASPLAGGDRPIEVTLAHDINKDYLIGRFAIDVSTTPIPEQKVAPTREIEQLKAQIAELAKRLPGQGKSVAQMVYQDRSDPPATYRLHRGDFLSPDRDRGELKPSVPSVLTGGESVPMKNRLDLARWLVSRENPLTARVIVNRVWMKLFGVGLVETENDFGIQGSSPTHPELLDWLANDWIESGWSIKHLIRSIVTSATYQRSSCWRKELASIDPANRYLSRQSRIRVDAEIVRDQALAVSGALVRRIGGPSVHPPQPDGVYNFTQNKKAWKEDTGGDRYRKTMYTEFFRSEIGRAHV